MMEDSKIIELYWLRDESAIHATSQKYGAYLFKIAYNILADSQDSEESVNDTYLKAWNSMPPHRPDLLAAFLGKITREQLKELRGLADCARYDDTPEEIERNYQRDCEFHHALLAISGNELLCSFSRLLEIFFSRREASCAMSQAAAAEHQGILDALETHNLELARGIMRNHLAKYKGE